MPQQLMTYFCSSGSSLRRSRLAWLSKVRVLLAEALKPQTSRRGSSLENTRVGRRRGRAEA
jgi:hypothetical protein